MDATVTDSHHSLETDSTFPRDKEFAKFQFGCEHYKRRCQIRAPCCNQIFPCRHCHNEAANSLSDPKERHDLVRQNVKQVVCSKYVKLSKRLLKSAQNVVSVWGNTFAINANSLMMIPQKNNSIVMTVEFVELVGVIDYFIARTVELAMIWAC